MLYIFCCILDSRGHTDVQQQEHVTSHGSNGTKTYTKAETGKSSCAINEQIQQEIEATVCL